jgi:hypothetical protein
MYGRSYTRRRRARDVRRAADRAARMSQPQVVAASGRASRTERPQVAADRGHEGVTVDGLVSSSG